LSLFKVKLTPAVALVDAILQVLLSWMHSSFMKKVDKVRALEAYSDPYTYGVVIGKYLTGLLAATVLTSPLHSFWVRVATLETTVKPAPDP